MPYIRYDTALLFAYGLASQHLLPDVCRFSFTKEIPPAHYIFDNAARHNAGQEPRFDMLRSLLFIIGYLLLLGCNVFRQKRHADLFHYCLHAFDALLTTHV